MARDYVETKRNGFFYIAGTRIPLASVAHAYRNGEAPECIHRNFPALSLEQVYGAIVFCLAHAAEVDAYLGQLERESDARAGSSAALPENPRRKLRARRHRAGG